MRNSTFGKLRLLPWETRYTPFSYFIRNERKKRNVSLRAFYKFLVDRHGGPIVGVDNSLISRWETANAEPSADAVQVLAIILEVPLQALASLIPSAWSLLLIEVADIVHILAERKSQENMTIGEMVRMLQDHIRHKYWDESNDRISLK